MNKTIIIISFLLSIEFLYGSITEPQAGPQAFGLTEKLGASIPDTVLVLNEDSVMVNVSDLINKPTLLSFVYYTCPTLCPKMMEGISELVNFSEVLPGEDYQVITLSIDFSESVTIANSAKKYYTDKITKDINPYFWRFFTADSASIKLLTDAVGWEFRQLGNDFVHTTSTVLLSPDGMVSQYFYGTYFNYMHFNMSVEKARNGEIVPTRLKTLKYCYNYQPEKNMKVEQITKIFGISIIVLAIGLFLILVFGRSGKTAKNH